MHEKISQIHDRWLNGITILLGYLWLISGTNKIASGKFVSGFTDFIRNEYLGKNTYSWYVSLLHSVVLPHGIFVAQVIQWGEFTGGIILLVCAFWLLFRDSASLHILISVASVGTAFLAFNIALAEGAVLPFINLGVLYEEGVSMDVLVFLISLCITLANLQAYKKEKAMRMVAIENQSRDQSRV